MMLLAVISHLAPWSFAASKNWQTDIAALLSVALIVALILKTRGKQEVLHDPDTLRMTVLPWFLVSLLLSAIYYLFFWSSHFYSRYSAPIVITAVPMLAIGFCKVRPALDERSCIALAAVLCFVFCIWDVGAFHRGRIYSSQVLSASYVHNWYPKARVGAFQSGVLGYYDPNVENLDGKLNQGALMAAQVHELPAFIDKEGIDVMIDWPSYLASLPKAYRSTEWQACPEPTYSNDSMCLLRRSTGKR